MNEDLTDLTLVELLDLLEPVLEPAPISMWPQTIGWVVLGLAVVVAAGWGVYRWISARRADAYRRTALAEIAAAADDPATLAAIVRRTALAAYPRGQVAGLHGDAWLAFLDATGGDLAFTEGSGRYIAAAPYRPYGPDPELTEAVRGWVRQHRRPSR